MKVARVDVEYTGVYAALSFWIAFLLLRRRALTNGWKVEQCYDWLIFALLGALAGARVGYFAFEIPAEFLSEPGTLLWHPGFSEHGAVVGLLGGTAAFARQRGASIWRTWDELAVAGACAFLLMSLAALLDNEVAGIEWNGMFRMKFPLYDERNDTPPFRFPVLHVQVLLALGLVLAALAVERGRLARRWRDGASSSLIVLLMSLLMLLVDPWKEQASHVLGAAYARRLVVLDVAFAVVALTSFVRKVSLPSRAVTA